MSTSTRPRVPAAAIAAAASRLFGTVVLDLADLSVGPAVYLGRLEAFQTIEGEDLGTDDGTLIALILPGTASDLIAEHGTPGKAAEALTRQLRAEGTL